MSGLWDHSRLPEVADPDFFMFSHPCPAPGVVPMELAAPSRRWMLGWDLGFGMKRGIFTLSQSFSLPWDMGIQLGTWILLPKGLHLCFLWQSHQFTIWVDFWNFLIQPHLGGAAGVAMGKGWNYGIRELLINPPLPPVQFDPELLLPAIPNLSQWIFPVPEAGVRGQRWCWSCQGKSCQDKLPFPWISMDFHPRGVDLSTLTHDQLLDC